MTEPRPAALPPAERTVGQLVAESIRFYGGRFWQVLPLGLAFAANDAAAIGRSVNTQTLLVWAFGPLICAAYVRACALVLGARWSWSALAAALVVFAPFPVLVRIYVLPGVAWLGLFGLAVPAAVAERLGLRAALGRGFGVARADTVHAIGGVATLALVYGVTRYALLVLLHTQGGQTEHVANVLSDLVLSPLLYVGAALLYVDQAARVE